MWLGDKAFGFIAVDGQDDVFVHATSVQGNRSELRAGDEVEFSLEENPRKPGRMMAKNVEVV
jgi:CspA family cold shock protein